MEIHAPAMPQDVERKLRGALDPAPTPLMSVPLPEVFNPYVEQQAIETPKPAKAKAKRVQQGCALMPSKSPSTSKAHGCSCA